MQKGLLRKVFPQRYPAQLLVVVILVLLVSVIVVMAVGSRLSGEAQQTARSRAAEQAAAFGSSAVGQLEALIDIGQLAPGKYFLDDRSGGLDICGQAAKYQVKCSADSYIDVIAPKTMRQRPVNKDDVLEINLTQLTGQQLIQEMLNASTTSPQLFTTQPLAISFGNEVAMNNNSTPLSQSRIIVKFFRAKQYNPNNNQYPVVAECIITNLETPAVQCVGDVTAAITNNAGYCATTFYHFPGKCVTFTPKSGVNYSFARLRPLLSGFSQIQVSGTGTTAPAYELAAQQYTVLRTNISVGSGQNAVNYSAVTIVDSARSLPAPFDYALYNGAPQPINKLTK